MKKIPLANGEYALVDDEDYQWLSNYRWYSPLCNGWAYPKARIGGVLCLMHRRILNAKKGEYVDHINGNILDNRRCNLRICTSAQNNQNQRKGKLKNRSGYKGVFSVPRNKKKPWASQISLNYRSTHIGYFKTAVEAARAYDSAAKKHFGEFACLNFPDESRSTQ